MKLVANSAAALVCGILFGAGALVSGMSNPAKVLNFFDVFGTWDPSLAFVMAGALAVTFVGYRIVSGRPAPVLAPEFLVPTRKDIDLPLAAGTVVFGVGWGLGGLCPGPALAALPIGDAGIATFALAMVIGIAAGRLSQRIAPPRPAGSQS